MHKLSTVYFSLEKFSANIYVRSWLWDRTVTATKAPSLLPFSSTPTNNTSPLAGPRQKIEFGLALCAECAPDLFISWWAVCTRMKEREREGRIDERFSSFSKINECNNQLSSFFFFFFAICNRNVLSWHSKWSTICMQIGVKLNPPLNWQTVSYAWDFLLSNIARCCILGYRDYFRTKFLSKDKLDRIARKWINSKSIDF